MTDLLTFCDLLKYGQKLGFLWLRYPRAIGADLLTFWKTEGAIFKSLLTTADLSGFGQKLESL
jgi:hypothetical protein